VEEVLVLGGGIGGLASALAFARAGHPVTVLERDHVPAAMTAAEAFEIERRGAPQSHQTHGFLARVMVVLRDRFPDVLDDLLAQGCTTMSGLSALGDTQPGDEDLKVLIVRRTTFEWVLRRAVEAEPGVRIRSGCGVSGLTTRSASGADQPPIVDGAVTDAGLRVPGAIVVAATGRRGDVPAWLRAHGVQVAEKIRESGLMYLSQWYRQPEGFEIEVDPKLAGDLGFVKYLAVPGDGRTLSITLALRAEDREVRGALRSSERFEAACRALPGPDQFFAGPPLEPIGGVRPMTALINRIRRFTDPDGRPLVAGFHAVGDAHTCTNPLYGRGCSLAVVQAVLLADAAAAHPGDALGRAEAYEAACRREVQPWWEVSVQMDRAGADPAGFAAGGGTDGGTDGGAARGLGAVLVAARTDPVIGRGLARFWNLLSTPAELMADPALVGRVADVVSRPGDFPLPARRGPTRGELLEGLAAAGGSSR
jgi:2-polyprenyl-6-methoxyphenol hydroxylase-like FAD-dependent oxidoreductase